MKATELLRSDHKVVEGLFKDVEGSDETEHPALFEEIRTELELHAHVEETIFYPALQEEGDEELIELTSEAIKEHVQMKTFLGELSVAQADTEKFESLLVKLIEDVRHHVEEEENEMFPMVESQFPTEKVELWGEQIRAEKDRFGTSAESTYA